MNRFMNRWNLYTEASESVGLGHLSRMCGLGRALDLAGQSVVLRTWPGTLEYLEARVGGREAREQWIGPLPYQQWNGTTEERRRYHVVVDTKAAWFDRPPEFPSRLFALMSDMYVRTDTKGANVIIRPHDTPMEFLFSDGAVVLSGAQYQPLREMFWEEWPKPEWGTDARWVDPRLEEVLGLKSRRPFTQAPRIFCFVGVSMYEALAMGGRHVYAMARNDAEYEIARKLGVSVFKDPKEAVRALPVPENKQLAARIRRGARSLANMLVDLAESL